MDIDRFTVGTASTQAKQSALADGSCTIDELAQELSDDAAMIGHLFWKSHELAEFVGCRSRIVAVSMPHEERERDGDPYSGIWIEIDLLTDETIDNQLDPKDVEQFLELAASLINAHFHVRIMRHDANIYSKDYVESKPLPSP